MLGNPAASPISAGVSTLLLFCVLSGILVVLAWLVARAANTPAGARRLARLASLAGLAGLVLWLGLVASPLVVLADR